MFIHRLFLLTHSELTYGIRWAGLREAIEDGLVWRGARSVVLVEYKEQKSSWPTSTDQVVVQTRDAQPPILPGEHTRRNTMGKTGGWQQVHSLAEIDNIYDIGFWRNIVHIFAAA